MYTKQQVHWVSDWPGPVWCSQRILSPWGQFPSPIKPFNHLCPPKSRISSWLDFHCQLFFRTDFFTFPCFCGRKNAMLITEISFFVHITFHGCIHLQLERIPWWEILLRKRVAELLSTVFFPREERAAYKEYFKKVLMDKRSPVCLGGPYCALCALFFIFLPIYHQFPLHTFTGFLWCGIMRFAYQALSPVYRWKNWSLEGLRDLPCFSQACLPLIPTWWPKRLC